MFGKIKEKILMKAFSVAYSRYDTDGSGYLDRKEMASFLNDTFQLLGYPHHVSSIEARIAIKMFDDNGDGKIAKEEAYKATKEIMSTAGGFLGGEEKSSGKVGGALPPPDDDEEFKTKIDFQPPEEID